MLTTIKEYACYAVKFTKNKPNTFSNREAHARCASPESALPESAFVK